MNPANILAIGFPAAVTIIVTIGFYKVFIKKKSINLFYTPFDQVTGQTEVEFHEEQEVLAEDEDQGEGKNKSASALISPDRHKTSRREGCSLTFLTGWLMTPRG